MDPCVPVSGGEGTRRPDCRGEKTVRLSGGLSGGRGLRGYPERISYNVLEQRNPGRSERVPEEYGFLKQTGDDEYE